MNVVAVWVLSIATVAWHWAVREPTRRVWAAGILIDVGWGVLYASLRLWGPLLMVAIFGLVHWRNLVTTSPARNGRVA